MAPAAGAGTQAEAPDVPTKDMGKLGTELTRMSDAQRRASSLDEPPALLLGEALVADDCEAEKSEPAQEAGPSVSGTGTVLNITKNIVGSGMFTLSWSVAQFSSNPMASVPAVALLALVGLVSAYGFRLVADVCDRTGASTYQGAWTRTLGRGSLLPALACVGKTFLGCVAYSISIRNATARILQQSLYDGYLKPAGMLLEEDCPEQLLPCMSFELLCVLTVTALVLVPLCLLRSLASLAKFSACGIVGNVFIAGIIFFRYAGGEYRPGGAYESMAGRHTPVQGSGWGEVLNGGIFVYIELLSTSLLAHYNAPVFYTQMATPADGRKVRKFWMVAIAGFGSAVTIISFVMVGGFLTFGSDCRDDALLNYSERDPWATVARVCLNTSLITAYPLLFYNVRSQIIGILGDLVSGAVRERFETCHTLAVLGLMAIVTAIAVLKPPLGTLMTWTGGIFGSSLGFIMPPLMMLAAERRGIGPRSTARERAFSVAILLFGLFVVGLFLVKQVRKLVDALPS